MPYTDSSTLTEKMNNRTKARVVERMAILAGRFISPALSVASLAKASYLAFSSLAIFVGEEASAEMN